MTTVMRSIDGIDEERRARKMGHSEARQIRADYDEVDTLLGRALVHLQADSGVSPVTGAVFNELVQKFNKALATLESGDLVSVREAMVEVEQAADSAKVAAEADTHALTRTRLAIAEAHDRLCEIKAKH